MKSEKYPAWVNVGRDVRRFVIGTNGSDTLEPGKDSILWSYIKPYLITEKEAAQIKMDMDADAPEECIHILLLKGQSLRMLENRHARKLVRLNLDYRYIIAPEGQAMVRRFFRTQLKQFFHTFMQGYFAARPDDGVEKEAITEFCLQYGIEVTNTAIEKFRKSWYRYKKANEYNQKSLLSF